ncbi:MAG TPA: AAA family ATPase [Actinomycetes bacterium]
MLVGREEALARIAWVVSGARAGHGGALLLSGEPGSGKSTLLDAARADADGMTVLRWAGAQDEREFPYAGVHALLRPLQRHWGELVPAQHDALEQALGSLSGEPPAPLLVGAAVLSVLDAAAADAPLLILIDDLQWVDIESREAIGFAARRLADDPVGLLLAARSEGAELLGVDRYDLPSLEPAAALEVLALNGVVRSVAERLAAVGGGNPLALVELATLLDDDQRRGAAPLPDPLPATSPAKVYATAFAALPLPVRLAAATAAIAGNAPAWVLAAALEGVGTDHRRLAEAEPTGLVLCSPRGVIWRHPLVRSAAAAAVSPAERRRVHAAVADALGSAQASAPAVVWHRVEASTGPDERLAGALEEVARTAASRGAHLAAAQAFEVASRVGTDPTAVPRRLGEAALAAWAGDDPATAARLIEEALPTVEDPDLRWRLSLTAGQVAQATAAPQQAWEAFLRAVDEARAAGRQDREVQALASAFNPALHLDDPDWLRRLAEQIAVAADPHDPVQAVRAHAVQGFTLLNADQAEAGRRHLEQALATIEDEDLLRTHTDLLQMTVQAAMWSGSPMRLREAIDETVARLRAAGDTRMLTATVRGLAWCDFSVAAWDAAAVRADDALDLERITGRVTDVADSLTLVATLEGARGQTQDALAHAREARRLAETLGSPWRTADALWCEVLALLSVGDLAALVEPTDALVALLRPGRVAAVQPEYLDAPVALAQLGRRTDATALLDLLQQRAGQDARPETRAGVLLVRCAVEPDSLPLAEEAAELAAELEGVEYVFPRARLLLAGGAMRRRLGQRIEARNLLRGAESDFTALGAAPWLARTREELRASGATLRSRAAPDDALTAAEVRVARCAADGLTNKEIAATLFLSGKTVEFHLGRIYRKLGVRSRSELVLALVAGDRDSRVSTGD